MRTAVAVLAIVTIGGASVAFADPPDTPVAPESPDTAAQKGPAEDSTGQNRASHTVPATAATTATETPAAAPAKPAPSASDEGMQEQLLRFQGYKLSMVRGQEKWCRRETPLGSHLASVMRCLTVEEAQEMAREGRQTTERIQRTTPGCLGVATGGCGK